MRRTGTTATPSASPPPACRRSATAAPAGSACPASCTSCTPTRPTTAPPEPTTASATASSTSRPSSSGTRSAAARCRSWPTPCRRWLPATRLVASLLHDIDEPISDLARAEIAATLADTLRSLGGRADRGPATIDLRAVGLARDYLAAHASEQTPASTLEAVTGVDRFTLARQFRRAFGTSPDRYRTMRRLGLARAAIERGLPLAQAAASAGFADQSHMTRQFKRAYGLTPARWTVLTGGR